MANDTPPWGLKSDYDPQDVEKRIRRMERWEISRGLFCCFALLMIVVSCTWLIYQLMIACFT